MPVRRIRTKTRGGCRGVPGMPQPMHCAKGEMPNFGSTKGAMYNMTYRPNMYNMPHRPRLGIRRIVRGRGQFMDWIKSTALPWIKSHHLISRGARTASAFGVPYVGAVGRMAGVAGWGRNRKGRKVTYRRRKYKSKNPRGGSLGGNYP